MIDMMIWTDDYGATATGYWSSHKRGLKQAVEITKFGSRWSIKTELGVQEVSDGDMAIGDMTEFIQILLGGTNKPINFNNNLPAMMFKTPHHQFDCYIGEKND